MTGKNNRRGHCVAVAAKSSDRDVRSVICGRP